MIRRVLALVANGSPAACALALATMTSLITPACSTSDGGGGEAGDASTTSPDGGSGSSGGSSSGSSSGSASGSGGSSGSASSSSGSSSGSASSGSGSGGAPVESTMQLVGRFDLTTPDSPRFAWPGSSVHVQFEGATIAVKLADTAPDLATTGGDVFSVNVDGAELPRLTITATAATSYPLASGLASGLHSLVLTKLTESSVGTAQLLGFTLDAGQSLQPAPLVPVKRKMEVLGDSISCGYGVEGANETCKFTSATENVSKTYLALTATALDAEYVDVAYSGKGIYRDAAGSTADEMPSLWLRTIASEPSNAWDFTRYAPDVLVVLLGANDFTTGDPGQPFVDAYTAFVKTARSKYPAAKIVCTLSPMLSDGYPAGAMQRTIARGYVQGVVKAANDGGDPGVSFFEFDEQQGSDGYGCDYHPSATTHQKMATKLTAALKTTLGW